MRDQPDELATNVLGSALDLAARNPPFALTPLFASAQTVWQRHNSMLEASQPGSHLWGGKWLTPRDYERPQAEKLAAGRRIAQVQEVLDRVKVLIDQQWEYVAEYERQMTEYQHSDEDSPEAKWWYDARRGAATARRKAAELTAGRDYDWKLLEYLKRSIIPRPTWPTRYAPVDPNA